MNWSNLKIYLALTLVSLLYGINYSVIKIVTPAYIGPYGFIVFRVSISAFIFWLLYITRQEKVDWKADGWRLVFCAMTGVAVNQLLFYKGISLTSAVNGSIIITVTPVLVLVWAGLLIGEKVTRQKVVGIFIALIGALIIIYQPSTSLATGDWRGDILIFGNGASYACYLVIVKPLMKKYRPMTVVTWIFTIGTLIVLPVGFSQAAEVIPSELPLKVYLSVGYAIVGVTVIVYFLNIWTLVKVDASVVGAFIYLQPVFATLTAILFFEEILLLKHFIASVFVFTGVWLVTRKQATQR